MSKLTDRWLEPSDITTLELCLERDPHHVGTKVEFFFRPGTVCKTYEDEKSPILFVRAAKALRLDIQFVDNSDHRRNLKAMLYGFDALAKKAKDNGFTEIIFNSSNEPLRKLCMKRFGFFASGEELRRYL
jgi:hypothetical protein